MADASTSASKRRISAADSCCCCELPLLIACGFAFCDADKKVEASPQKTAPPKTAAEIVAGVAAAAAPADPAPAASAASAPKEEEKGEE